MKDLIETLQQANNLFHSLVFKLPTIYLTIILSETNHLEVSIS